MTRLVFIVSILFSILSHYAFNQTYAEFGFATGLTSGKLGLNKHNGGRSSLNAINTGGIMEVHHKRFLIVIEANLITQNFAKDNTFYLTEYEKDPESSTPQAAENFSFQTHYSNFYYKNTFLQMPVMFGCEFGRERWQNNAWQVYAGIGYNPAVARSFEYEIFDEETMDPLVIDHFERLSLKKKVFALSINAGTSFKWDFDRKSSFKISYKINTNGPVIGMRGMERTELANSDTYYFEINHGNPVVFLTSAFHSLQIGYTFVLTPYRPKSFF